MAEYEIEFRCKHCGKPISILHPSQWGYKVRNKKGGWTYYCTWKCLRADEKRIEQAEQKKKEARKAKQQEKLRNDRLEVLKGMMEAVSQGKNAYDYLKSMGYADPKDTLRRLRITAKEEAPKIYRKMEKMGLLDLRKGHSGKGVDRMSQNKLTREQKEKAVQLALNGGDYLEHLKKCGAKNPSAAWWYIKKTLAKSNPTLLAKVMKKTGEIEEIKAPEETEGGPVVEKADKLQPEADVPQPEFPGEEGLVVDQHSIRCNGHVFIRNGPLPGTEQPEPEVNYMEQVKPVEFQTIEEKVITLRPPEDYGRLKIVRVRGEFGDYSIGGKDNWLRFEANNTKTEITMPGKDMQPFVKELIKAAEILGVEM